MANKCKPDDLFDEISAVLNAYADDVTDVVKASVDQIAKQTVAEIRENARQAFPEGSGDYAKSWTSKVDRSGAKRGKYGKIIYAKGSGGSIAHLLEHGHAKVDGGFVQGRPHIAPAEKHAEEQFPQLVRNNLTKMR